MATDRNPLDVSTNYLKLGATVYKLAKVSHPILEVEKELKTYYKNAYEGLVASLKDTFSAEGIKIQDAQVRRIEDYIAKTATSKVELPSSLFGKCVIWYDNSWYETKLFIYQPLIHKTNLALIADKGISLEGVVLPTRLGRTQNILIRLKSVPSLPVILAYSNKANKIITPNCRTFHTMESGKLCVGDHNPGTIWAMENELLVNFLNTINHFSLAAERVRCSYSNITYTLQDIIKPDNIVEIVKEEATTWHVT